MNNFLIKKQGHPLLSRVIKKCDLTKSHKDTVDEMFNVLATSEGIALAANQLAIDKRIIIIYANGFGQEFLNPVITKTYGKKTVSREGCLSSYNQYKVYRYKRIVVEGVDVNNKPIRYNLKGLLAVAIQHEIDHLNGIGIWHHGKRIF